MEDYFSGSGRVIKLVLWTKTISLMVAAWVVMLVDERSWRIALLLAATACVSAALSATFHIRTYNVRVCHLMREIAGLDYAKSHSRIGLESVR